MIDGDVVTSRRYVSDGVDIDFRWALGSSHSIDHGKRDATTNPRNSWFLLILIVQKGKAAPQASSHCRYVQ